MRVLRTVVEAGGFTAAAHVMGTSQSFVSQTLSQLEKRLGVLLLQRSTRGHRLTAEGESFLEFSQKMLAELDAAEQRIGAPDRAPAGVLRVTAPVAFGKDQLVPRLPAFFARYPQLELRLSLTDRLVQLIDEGVDLAVRMGRLRDSRLASRRLCGLRRVVVASPAYLAAHGQPALPRDLAKHNCLLWLGPQEHLNRWPFRIADEEAEVAVRGNFRSGDGLALFDLCVAGVGVMRLAEHLARPAIRDGKLVPLLEPFATPEDGGIHAVFLADTQSTPRVRAFVDFVREAFEPEPWNRP